MTDVTEIRADGRNNRRQESRDTLIATGRDLILEGNFRPTDLQIVNKAGRSLRTFYSLFGTTEGFWMEVFHAHEMSIKSKVAETLNEGDGFTLLRLILLGKT